MKNERQLYWSPGLKALLGVKDEQPETEVMDTETVSEFERLLLKLSAVPWGKIVSRELRAQLWMKAYETEGNVDAIKAWLKQEAGLDLDEMIRINLEQLVTRPPIEHVIQPAAPVATEQLDALLETTW